MLPAQRPWLQPLLHRLRRTQHFRVFRVWLSSPNYWISGDEFYISGGLLTPYEAELAGSGTFQDAFSFFHSSIRIQVDHSFSILVSRWPIVGNGMSFAVDNSYDSIGAMLALRNYRIGKRRSGCFTDIISTRRKVSRSIVDGRARRGSGWSKFWPESKCVVLPLCKDFHSLKYMFEVV